MKEFKIIDDGVYLRGIDQTLMEMHWYPSRMPPKATEKLTGAFKQTQSYPTTRHHVKSLYGAQNRLYRIRRNERKLTREDFAKAYKALEEANIPSEKLVLTSDGLYSLEETEVGVLWHKV